MNIFVWTVVIFIAIECILRVFLLSRGVNLPRTNAGMAWDVVIGVGFVVWGCVVLATAP